MISDLRRRAKAAERKANAELDKLTVQARFSTVLARRASANDLNDMLDATLRRAMGDGQTANYATKLVVEMIRIASFTPDGGEEATGIAWEDMTPQQRAAARAIVEREVAALQAALDSQDAE